MIEKNIIVVYIDWTDFIAHLTGDEDYAIGETEKERLAYALEQADKFFGACKRLENLGNIVATHVMTGGGIKYIQKLNEGIIEKSYEYNMPNLFKSVTTEYGGDIMVNYVTDGVQVETYIVPNEVNCNYAKSEELREVVKALIPANYEPSFKDYRYYQCASLKNEKITKSEFDSVVGLLEAEFADKDIQIYAYYCPGYGIDIDFVPRALNKARGVKEIQYLFYSDENIDKRSRENYLSPNNIGLEIFAGDFSCVELGAVDESMQNNVLFVATEEETGIRTATEGTELKTFIQGQKLESAINAINHIADVIEQTGKLPNYSKGNYQANHKL